MTYHLPQTSLARFNHPHLFDWFGDFGGCQNTQNADVSPAVPPVRFEGIGGLDSGSQPATPVDPHHPKQEDRISLAGKRDTMSQGQLRKQKRWPISQTSLGGEGAHRSLEGSVVEKGDQRLIPCLIEIQERLKP